jgi:hypothetical protein
MPFAAFVFSKLPVSFGYAVGILLVFHLQFNGAQLSAEETWLNKTDESVKCESSKALRKDATCSKTGREIPWRGWWSTRMPEFQTEERHT